MKVGRGRDVCQELMTNFKFLVLFLCERRDDVLMRERESRTRRVGEGDEMFWEELMTNFKVLFCCVGKQG